MTKEAEKAFELIVKAALKESKNVRLDLLRMTSRGVSPEAKPFADIVKALCNNLLFVLFIDSFLTPRLVLHFSSSSTDGRTSEIREAKFFKIQFLGNQKYRLLVSFSLCPTR